MIHEWIIKTAALRKFPNLHSLDDAPAGRRSTKDWICYERAMRRNSGTRLFYVAAALTLGIDHSAELEEACPRYRPLECA
jgi:hypothetical protein